MIVRIFAAAVALAAASPVLAQTVIKETEQGVHSAPVAGATPQARDNPAPDTVMREQHETTTIVEPRAPVVEERPTGSVQIETRTR